jgi:hypothetical protein
MVLRRACAAALCASLVSLALAGSAQADTAFGGDPNQAVTPGLSCGLGAPYIVFGEVFAVPGTAGSTSCMWGWSNPSAGTDIVPIPVTGGSGTITSVTLPAMASPGPMEVVVLTAALAAGSQPSKPDYLCCQVKQVGPPFSVPAGQVTTVPQNLHVSATEQANLEIPGDTSFGDLLGISVKSPTASLPLRYTGAAEGTNFDGGYAYYPAPAGANGEYRTPINEYGFQMLARFTLALDGAPAPAPAPAGPAAGRGLKLIGKPLRVGADGKTVTIGEATNPPTAATTQTLTAPGAARAAASGSAARKKAVVLGAGKTTVATGKTVPVKLRLNGKGRARLKKGRGLTATLTVVSANAKGETQTVVRSVTIKPAARKKSR